MPQAFKTRFSPGMYCQKHFREVGDRFVSFFGGRGGRFLDFCCPGWRQACKFMVFAGVTDPKRVSLLNHTEFWACEQLNG